MAKVWEGTHVWIWEPWAVLNGDPTAMIAKVKDLGATGVMVKFANGSLTGDPVSQNFMNWFKKIAPEFKSAGLTVAGWIYQYLTDVVGEVDACAQAIAAGAEWIVLDAEKDVNGKGMQVQQFGQMLREKFPNLVVGLSSYAIASYHDESKGEVPFNAYAPFVDVILPQVYWADMSYDVAVAFTASVASYKKYNKPIAPSGQAYGAATAADMARFVQIGKQAGLTGISWWSMDSATAAQFAAVKTNILQPQAPVPSASQATPGPAKDVAADNWAAPAVAWAIGNGIMHVDENGNFNPTTPLTRDQAAQLLFNFLHQTNKGAN